MSRKRSLLRRAMMTGSLLFLAYPAAAQSNQQLQDQIRQLQQQLENLQNKVDQQPTAPAAAPAAGGPRLTLSPNNRPGFASADGQNTIELTSRLHFDIADYLKVEPQSPTGPHSLTSGVNARRARIGVLGKFMGDWNYTLIAEFGGSTDGPQTSNIENAYISYNGFRPVAVDFGYLDVPFTLDEATSSNDIMFIERAEIQNVVTNMAANDERAAFGVRSNNDRYWAGTYLTGPVAGATHTGSNMQQLGGTARASYQVLQGSNYSLHLGIDGEYVFTPRTSGAPIARTLTLSDRPELRVDPTVFLTTAAIPARHAGAFGPEVAAGLGSAFFQGEYYHIFIDQSGQAAAAPTPRLNFDGYYLQASYVLTGESRKYIPTTGAYSGVRPARPVGSGGWGAWEVAVRWSHIDLDSHATPGLAQTATGGVFGGRANGLALGVNWYVNNNIRFMLNYIHDDIDKLAANGTTPAGARIDAIAMRTQIAF
ncbi:MAG TPA: porin [Stellaceae bacterium]|nr:porin [Stellaceae bacterium]